MTCVVCQRRTPERPMVCDGCRRRIDVDLSEIVDLYALLPTALEPGPSTGQRVSGSREAPLPLRVDPLDLALPVRNPGPVRDDARLQTGHQPVAVRLWWIVDDWRSVRGQGERQPEPTVVTLTGWLRHRLDWACDHHPAIDEAAAELRTMTGELRAVLGRSELRHRLPAPCPDCDMLTLYRDDGSDYVECGSCHRLWTEDEYAWLVRTAAEEVA